VTDRELMQMALEALELLARYEHPLTKIQVRKPRDGGSIVTVYPHQVATDAAEPLRERLAQPEQEPVACPFPCGWKTMFSIIIKDGAFLARGLTEGEPVTGHQREIVMRLIDYAKTMASHGMTAPPQREWKGLTDEEYEAMAENHVTNCYFDTLKYARAIEAKLKEKNI